MSLRKTLNQIVAHYRSDIVMIRDFVGTTYETLDDLAKLFDRHKHELTTEDSESLRDLAEMLNEALDQLSSKSKKLWSKNIEITARTQELVFSAVKGIKSREFLAEMALSYILSFQEGFVKDYLREVLSNRPELLRSGKNLSHEEVIEFTSIAQLRRHIASVETENLGYSSIDDIGSYLHKKFNIVVHEEPFWAVLREAAYRRNLIIHNRGVVNKIYVSKLGMEVEKAKLKTDERYVRAAADSILEFINFLHRELTRKLKLKM